MQKDQFGPAPKESSCSLLPASKEVIPNEVNQKFQNSLVSIPDIVQEAAQQFFHPMTLRAQDGVRTVNKGGMEYVILVHITTAALPKKIDEHVQNNVEACKAGKALGKRMLCLIFQLFAVRHLSCLQRGCEQM